MTLMVEVRSEPTVTIAKDNTSIILSIQEAAQVKELLDGFLAKYADYLTEHPTGTQAFSVNPEDMASNVVERPILKQMTAGASQQHYQQPQQAIHMSEDKKRQLRDHVVKRLTAEPQSLTTLLKGVSYVPNYLPFIRDMIEQDETIGIHQIGKRALYYKKSTSAKNAPANMH